MTTSLTKAEDNCAQYLVRVSAGTGAFIIRKDSMEFKEWRLKTPEQVPDSYFAYSILSVDELNAAHAIQSRVGAERALADLVDSNILVNIEDLGSFRLSEVVARDGMFLPNSKFINNILSAMENRRIVSGDWKYILFYKDGKIFCYVFLVLGSGDRLNHNFAAKKIIQAIPALKIIGGDMIQLEMESDKNGLTKISLKRSFICRMEPEESLRTHMISGEEEDTLRKKYGNFESVILSFIKLSLKNYPNYQNMIFEVESPRL